MYAIFENGSKQYRVSEGDTVKLEKLHANVGDVVEVQVDRGRELITLQVTLGEKTGA